MITPIEKDRLLSIIPHRGKMILLSRVTDYDIEQRRISAEFDVSPECIFFEDGKGIPSWISFEIMAQSISALNGIINTISGIPARAGFLLSVSRFSSKTAFFKAGETVFVKAAEEFRDDASLIHQYKCSLFSKNKSEPDASAAITVMEADSLQSATEHPQKAYF